MELEIKAWGNSQGIRLPKALLQKMGADIDEVLLVSSSEPNKLVLRRKAQQPGRRKAAGVLRHFASDERRAKELSYIAPRPVDMDPTLMDSRSLLRYMLIDDLDQYEDALRAILAGAWILPETLSQLLLVLTQVYHLDRLQLSNCLQALLEDVQVDGKQDIIRALDLYKTSQLEYLTCRYSTIGNTQE